MIKRNGRWITDEELYPEQFVDLPEEAEPKKRNHAVKLGDIDKDDGENTAFGKDLRAILGSTAPKWKKPSLDEKNTENAVNPRGKRQNTEEFSDESFEEIKKARQRETAKAYAMRAVASSALTQKKLSEKLLSRGYTEDETEEAINYVKSFGYINDARMAQDMVEKLAARCWGRFKICYYLKGKGIDAETVESLDFSEVDFPYYCARLMRKYSPEKRDAMLRAVKNAGYTSEDIRAARRLISEEE